MEQKPVTRMKVPLNKRLAFLPKYAGNYFFRYEQLVYDCMGKACKEYGGGYWEFYTLSNGGFYMAFDSEEIFAVEWIENYFQDEMSADALSIGVNLFVQNALAWKFPDAADHYSEAFYRLRDFALSHKEADKIMRFID